MAEPADAADSKDALGQHERPGEQDFGGGLRTGTREATRRPMGIARGGPAGMGEIDAVAEALATALERACEAAQWELANELTRVFREWLVIARVRRDMEGR